jgi:hypothetical protein
MRPLVLPRRSTFLDGCGYGRFLHVSRTYPIKIGKELIVIESAELGTELYIEVPFGKGGLHGSRGHWREGLHT